MTDLPALVTASVRTADGARYFDHADLTSHLAVWIKAALVRQHGIADVVVTAHPQNADEEDREIQLADTREIVAKAEFAKRGSVVDGTLRFLLGEIDRLRAAATVPASASTDQAALAKLIADAVQGVLPTSSSLACEVVADAVLTVLPAPADRAAALREAAEVAVHAARGCGDSEAGQYAASVAAGIGKELRRLADAASGPGGAAGETQQDERPRCPHCRMPHDLTPDVAAVCASIRASIAADEAQQDEAQATPCSQPNACDGTELCSAHEREQAHAEGEHCFCGPECRDQEVVHACPPDGTGLTPCCGRTPFELPLTDRISSEAAVTCPGPAAVSQPGKEA